MSLTQGLEEQLTAAYRYKNAINTAFDEHIANLMAAIESGKKLDAIITSMKTAGPSKSNSSSTRPKSHSKFTKRETVSERKSRLEMALRDPEKSTSDFSDSDTRFIMNGSLRNLWNKKKAEEATAPKAEKSEEVTTPKAEEPEEVIIPKTEESEEDTAPKAEKPEEVTTPKAEEPEEVIIPKAEESEEDTTPKAEKSEEVIIPKAEKSKEDTALKAEKSKEDTALKAEKSEEVIIPKTEESEEDTAPKAEEPKEVIIPKAEKSKEDTALKAEKSEEVTAPKAEEPKEDTAPKAEKPTPACISSKAPEERVVHTPMNSVSNVAFCSDDRGPLPRDRMSELWKTLESMILAGEISDLSEKDDRDVMKVHTLSVMKKLMQWRDQELTDRDREVINNNSSLQELMKKRPERKAKSSEPKRSDSLKHMKLQARFRQRMTSYKESKKHGEPKKLSIRPRELETLRDEGLITEGEYDEAKEILQKQNALV